MNGVDPAQNARLFVAMPLPDTVIAQLAALPQPGHGARRVAPADLHITIRFLGDVDGQQTADVMAALAGVRKKPFHIALRGLGVFAGGDHVALYAAVESTRNLADLCARVTDRLTPLGFDFGARPFVPHVTLARVPAAVNLDKYMKFNDKKVNMTWEATHFSLMESGGMARPDARYAVRGTWPLVQ